ncbi:MAG TPA: hypothetical protein PLJ62_14550 [Thermoflexales bacterium]|nr:hypothetical protein [Thermoflexales bacterium]
MLPPTSPFAQILRAGRDQFNAQFAAAKHQYPLLDGAAFGAHLEQNVAPLVDAVAAVQPGRASDVAQTAYALSLELVGQQFIGAGARYPLIERGWREAFPALAAHIAARPQAMLAALTNALYNLSQTPDTRGGQWIAEIKNIAPACADADQLLQTGQVLAWRMGMAHYRDGALAVCQTLPPALALAALGISGAADEATRDLTVNLLRGNPWLRVDGLSVRQISQLKDKPQKLGVTSRVGVFRGFGGVFMSPPLVASDGAHLFARSENECWLITADAYGATLHRSDPSEFETAQKAGVNAPKPFTLVKGAASRDGLQASFPELAQVTSIAQTAHTLAVTTPATHAITLIAKTQE